MAVAPPHQQERPVGSPLHNLNDLRSHQGLPLALECVPSRHLSPIRHTPPDVSFASEATAVPAMIIRYDRPLLLRRFQTACGVLPHWRAVRAHVAVARIPPYLDIGYSIPSTGCLPGRFGLQRQLALARVRRRVADRAPPALGRASTGTVAAADDHAGAPTRHSVSTRPCDAVSKRAGRPTHPSCRDLRARRCGSGTRCALRSRAAVPQCARAHPASR